ncbi:uncharacterized protein LOC135477807 [Liolophura sinensis]|uniref:uncharacterized protein LOC135477807 n=1 Tax=Liolophura sinensis TaxID=3198878 RepID=UPI0031588204
MFKFNFPDPSTNEEDEGTPVVKSQTDKNSAEEMTLCADLKKFEGVTKHLFVCNEQTTLRYLDCQEVEEQLCAESCELSAISQAVSTQSDLLPGVYEGGLKVWECSLDLVNHLSSLEIAFRGLSVLELGCGAGLPGLCTLTQQANVTFQHLGCGAGLPSLYTLTQQAVTFQHLGCGAGLPGLYALTQQANVTFQHLGCGAGLPGLYTLTHQANVTFQDYLSSVLQNKEVITDYTMPNCLLNAPRDVVEGMCHFYCGDWGSLSSLLEDKEARFDIILTSETIYQPTNYKKLHHLFYKFSTETGKIYVAAKVYYFGVGGGVADFVNFVKKQKVFSVESTVTHKTGGMKAAKPFPKRGERLSMEVGESPRACP